MASDQIELTLHDFMAIMRGIVRSQFEYNTDPDQDESDPPASNQTEMPQVTVQDNMNNSTTNSIPSIQDSTDSQTNTDPDQDSPERSDPRHRLIIMNPLSRRVLIIEGSASGINTLAREVMTPDGPPPASKASIEAMASVETKEDDECVICFDEFAGGLAKEMPCKHKFHGECVEKWLKINGSCPVCRYKMPVDDENAFNFKNLLRVKRQGEEDSGLGAGILIGDPDQMATNGSNGHDSEMQD